VVLELGSNFEMCATSAKATYKGGSSAFIPDAKKGPFNLVQCMFDIAGTQDGVADMCATSGGVAGTESCKCNTATGKKCASPADCVGNCPSDTEECGVSVGGFCNRVNVPLSANDYLFDLESSASKAQISLAEIVSGRCCKVVCLMTL
jgi:hypothetical protein